MLYFFVCVCVCVCVYSSIHSCISLSICFCIYMNFILGRKKYFSKNIFKKQKEIKQKHQPRVSLTLRC
uniref:Secreted protein n=1 Tax=Octopus bimaculoides TaxID=37653 RepID=A0A0L8HXU8_OCTBM